MAARIVVLAGAGNVRCAPPVIATIAQFSVDKCAEFRLFDANAERLDLMDRLCRVCLSTTKSEIMVRATGDFEEAVDGVTDLVLSLNEDGSRRMVEVTTAPSLENSSFERDLTDHRRGDPNRPTPVQNLSRQTRQMLERPAVTNLSREDALRGALRLISPQIPPKVRILSLIRNVVLPPQDQVTHLTWPEALSESQVSLAPHQILRWVLRQESVDELLAKNLGTPLRRWLTDEELFES